MKLALVNPPFFGKVFNEDLSTVDDEFGIFPHIAFGWVAQAAKEAGWEVRLWDTAATKAGLSEVVEQIGAWDTDLIAFGAQAAQSIMDLTTWAKQIKALTGLPILLGGYEAKVYPKELMSHGCFDFLSLADAHLFLPEFLRAFEKGKGYESVPDLVYLDRKNLHITFPGMREHFSKFPMPDRTVFPNELYYSHVSQRRNYTVGISHLGCPYPCNFCCTRLSKYEDRTALQMVQEMEACSFLGIREIDWSDPSTLHDRQRALDLAYELKRRKLDMIWSCRSRVDSLSFSRGDQKPDEELIGALAESGCRRIFFGVESGDDAMLARMSKKQAVENTGIYKTLSCVREAGIMALGFFILGAPGETRTTAKKTVKLALKLPLYYTDFQIALIKPHSAWEKEYIVKATGIDYWREHIAGRIGEYPLPMPWTKLKRSELERIAKWGYIRFFTRPAYIVRMLRRIETSEEFWRYMRVGVQLFLRPIHTFSSRSLLGRLFRATQTLVESALVVIKPGARHSVTTRGGGFSGAFILSVEEFKKRKGREVLTKERVKYLLSEKKHEMVVLGKIPDNRLAGRYLPVFDVDSAREREN